ncbi:electron transfer flavoprotein subunit beta/FixA family protein [Pontibacter sp. G13]|uniref:electron transfer flavoprotein subunit beta/FixA family protein n=1 Tax=Pontibacter sp. G13 TaxID=3074898 RepID=UPI00288BBF39|nr:electron transfer flavoprotein subunit beta/FixA family protein [Pontibacter sp. G13]WNJ16583.1 electron transfer flavoprotein subunit beta/FixA family protein [Pontibacter sp. G13]
MMKILVCISHVPDTTTKIQFEADGSGLNKTGVTFVINPYCEYGLSRALGLREEGKQVSITAICVGGPEVEPTLRKALAIGADDAVRIDADATDSAFVAKQIANYANSKEFDIIFTGKESIDFNNSLVPGMIAENLGFSFVSFATKFELTSDDTATVQREIPGGVEVIEAKLPTVISCQKGIAEWRIPNMRGIMAARKKPLSAIPASDSDVYTETVSFGYPPAKAECQYFEPDNAGALVTALADKGLI